MQINLLAPTVCIAALLLTSCRPREESGLKHLFLPHSQLVSRILKNKVNICIKASSAYQPKLQNWTRTALVNWLEPIKKIEIKTFESIVFDCDIENIDLTVELRDAVGRAHFDILSGYDNAPIILFTKSDDKTINSDNRLAATLVHEIGHAFGFDDLYAESTLLPGPVKGQPGPAFFADEGSVMAQVVSSRDEALNITPLDRLSIAHLFGSVVELQRKLPNPNARDKDRLLLEYSARSGDGKLFTNERQNACEYQQYYEFMLAIEALELEPLRNLFSAPSLTNSRLFHFTVMESSNDQSPKIYFRDGQIQIIAHVIPNETYLPSLREGKSAIRAIEYDRFRKEQITCAVVPMYEIYFFIESLDQGNPGVSDIQSNSGKNFEVEQLTHSLSVYQEYKTVALNVARRLLKNNNVYRADAAIRFLINSSTRSSWDLLRTAASGNVSALKRELTLRNGSSIFEKMGPASIAHAGFFQSGLLEKSDLDSKFDLVADIKMCRFRGLFLFCWTDDQDPWILAGELSLIDIYKDQIYALRFASPLLTANIRLSKAQKGLTLDRTNVDFSYQSKNPPPIPFRRALPTRSPF